MPNVNLVSRIGQSEVLQAGRIQVRILEDGSLTDDLVGTIEAVVPARTNQTPPHLHRSHVETILVRSGSLQFTIANGVYRVREGEFVVVPIGAAHTFGNPFDTPVMFHATFAPASFIQYFRDIAEITKSGVLDSDLIYQVMARYDTYPA